MADGVSVPTISVGGFLGAGKTSLINNMLRQAAGRRIVVFVNDFGALNIDYDLIETVSSDRIALSNGCVCCTLNEDLVRSMVRFCEADRPDLFVIEASGVANPRALDASLLGLQQAGKAHMRRRAYVIDADQFGGLDYADTEDLVDHAAASDLIVLNKSDLATTARICYIEALLARSAPGASVFRASHCDIPFEIAAGQEGFVDLAGIGEIDPHKTSEIYGSCAFESFPHVTRERLKGLTGVLTRMCLRAKGTVYFEDAPDVPVHIETVGHRARTQERAIGADELRPPARLVAIGWAHTMNPRLLSEVLGMEPIIA